MELDGTDPQGRERRGRMATSAAFFVQGLCFAVVVTRVSVLQNKFHLSNGQLTLVLLIVPVIAGVGSVISGPLAARLGSGMVLRVAQPLVCLSLLAIGFASTRPELYLSVGLFGLFLGAVDATMLSYAIAKQAHRDGSTLREAALASGAVSADDYDRWVDPEAMTHPG